MTEPATTPASGAHRRKSYRRVSAVPKVQSITNAATAHSDEMRDRMIKYATAMGIRMACLLLLFVFDGWFKLIPIVGAVVLPWVAVVIANGGSDITKFDTVELLDQAPVAQLAPTAENADTDEPVILVGEIVPEESNDDGGTATPQEQDPTRWTS